MAIKVVIVPGGVTEYHIPDIATFQNTPFDPLAWDGLEPDDVVMKTYVSRYNPEKKSFNSVTLSDGTTVLPVYYDSPDYHLFQDKLPPNKTNAADP